MSPTQANVDDDSTESESNSDYDDLEETIDDIMDQVFGDASDLDSEDEHSREDTHEHMSLWNWTSLTSCKARKE